MNKETDAYYIKVPAWMKILGTIGAVFLVFINGHNAAEHWFDNNQGRAVLLFVGFLGCLFFSASVLCMFFAPAIALGERGRLNLHNGIFKKTVLCSEVIEVRAEGFVIIVKTSR